jgi:hypothetical protein
MTNLTGDSLFGLILGVVIGVSTLPAIIALIYICIKDHVEERRRAVAASQQPRTDLNTSDDINASEHTISTSDATNNDQTTTDVSSLDVSDSVYSDQTTTDASSLDTSEYPA